MLFNVFSKIFAKKIENLNKMYAIELLEKHKKEEAENRAKYRLMEIEIFLGAPVIALSNEWNEPIIGEIVAIDAGKGSPWITYKNYITGKESYTMVTPFAFSMQKLKMLGKLNPDEICCLFYEGRSHHGEFKKHKTYGSAKKNEFTNYETWIKNLTKNGFFEKFGDFLKEEEEKQNIRFEEMRKQWGDF